jgi:hypothetical protein
MSFSKVTWQPGASLWATSGSTLLLAITEMSNWDVSHRSDPWMDFSSVQTWRHVPSLEHYEGCCGDECGLRIQSKLTSSY